MLNSFVGSFSSVADKVLKGSYMSAAASFTFSPNFPIYDIGTSLSLDVIWLSQSPGASPSSGMNAGRVNRGAAGIWEDIMMKSVATTPQVRKGIKTVEQPLVPTVASEGMLQESYCRVSGMFGKVGSFHK